jgi:S1-C subfamily serine protease
MRPSADGRGDQTEGVAVRQTVSAPVAVVVVVFAAIAAVFVFGRQGPQRRAEDEVFVLPFEPPIEDRELVALRKGMAPLGAFVVMAPLVSDRFKGARVAMVVRGSPASEGDLRPGDLVLRFNDTKTTNPYALAAAIARADPDRPNEVVVERAGEEKTLIIRGVDPSSLEDRAG